MCTLLAFRHVHPEWPLLLAANRDERHDRPAEGPQVLVPSPRIIGGRDLERQGTWMGVTEHGFFVGLTNQRGSANLMRSPYTRGEVVLNALRAGSQEGVEDYLAGLDARRFRPFNLLYGDALRLRVAYARPDAERVRLEDVPPGVHVLSNDVLDSPALPKVPRARALAERLAHQSWPELARSLQTLLADHVLPEHGPDPLPEEDGHPELKEFFRQCQALCIHTPHYGTRSSAIVALTPGRVAHYLASDVAPCQGAFRDVTALVSSPPEH
ncbi:hypothetical protein CYFUS_003352 [Cystobacter fuscus]|uniref:NRDE family protein n=1 Tax=Cystobacter fuscus TaxID=43 RepID=A0A250J351_9BACT|nr:NRDE family protein [Cystobacter fuscus]ATB37927.1 hypothetical protein CYFUS_003352 [Cystobacter fuscus]